MIFRWKWKGFKKAHVEVAGQRCRFLKTGAGPSLVLVASPLILASAYRPLAVKLKRAFTVYVVEVPGSGLSSPLRRPWAYREYAWWLHGFFASQEIPRAFVLGHSNSGPIAAEFARLFPDQVDKLILVDSTGLKIRSGSLWRMILARLFDSLLEIRLTVVGMPQLVFNAIRHTRNFFHQLTVSSKVDLARELSSIRVRTLIAWGGRDHTMPRDRGREMQKLIPNASLIVSRKGSHDWLIEKPSEFARILESWTMPERSEKLLT